MRFSVGMTPYSRFPDLASLQASVQTAERLGFHGVSIGDHVVIPHSHIKTLSPVWYDPLVLGTAVAASSQRLRILFATFVMPYHEPLGLAKAIASLDVLSGGRVTVAAAVGWIEGEFEALGVPFKERGARTDEYLRAMKELWTSERPAFQGRFVSFRDIAFEPRPVQRPHPPVWIGGGVPRTLRRAAELGDGWHPLGRPKAQLAAEAAELRRLLAERGRDPSRFTFSYTVHWASVAGQTVRHTRAAGGEAAVLSGDPEQAIQEIRDLEGLGFSHLTVRLRGLTHQEMCAAMERFHREVMEPLAR